MSRWLKVVLWIIAAIVLFNIVIFAWAAIANATIAPDPYTGGLTRRWCRHHPHKCNRAFKDAHYRRLHVSGHNYTVTLPARDIGKAALVDVPCKYRRFHQQYGGDSPRAIEAGHFPGPPFTLWNAWLTVRWCWDGRQIVSHAADSGVNHILFNVHHLSDNRISKWYPWKGDFTPRHNGRYEGIESTTQECLFFFGWTCVLEYHPWIHVHEHADRSYTANGKNH